MLQASSNAATALLVTLLLSEYLLNIADDMLDIYRSISVLSDLSPAPQSPL